MNYKKHFKNKRITVMGLGLLGRGIGVVKFLAECGADLTVTDLKTKEQLKPALKELKKFKNIKYVLGKHNLNDFRNRDLIIKAASVLYDSEYIKQAQKENIPVEMDASLFLKLAKIKTIGITGTRGKSTVTDIVYQILKKHYKSNVFLGGNVRGIATLPILKKAKKNDLIIMELDSWQLQGFGDSKISPEISVFTNFLRDHMNYYKNSMARYFNDKANIFKYQNKDNHLIISSQADSEIKKRFKGKIQSKVIKPKKQKWLTNLPGIHNQENINLAAEVLKLFKINKSIIKKELENYTGMPGRLEFIREFKGAKYYNDTNATTPEAVMAAINSFENKDIVLIAGGNDKELKFKEMAKVIKKRIKKLILIKGAATDKLIKYLKDYEIVDSMEKAVKKANQSAQKGDIVLMSPGATSFGVFKNEYDRGDQFRELVKNLKQEDIFKNIKKAHFIGIGGIGVSALAKMMLTLKKEVTGSDPEEHMINQRIKKLGAKVFIGHKKSNISKDTDIVFYTPAIKGNNPELLKAKELNIPTYSYPEGLGLISKDKYTIAISGTHGKTTTTAMLAETMISAKKDPTVIIGSFLRKQKDNFIPGQSKYFLVEACEYKESFLNLYPNILAITNIDNDHLDYFKNIKNIQKVFAKMINKVPENGYIICNPKDNNTKEALKLAKIKGEIIDYTKEKKLKLEVPGEHNIQNAQVALAVSKIINIKEPEKFLKKYLGVWRRFEYKGKTKKNALIYDDYAHHSTEVKATIKAAREKFKKQKIYIIFQPHLYSRTKLLINDFAKSFNPADKVIITDIYAAREKDTGLIHSRDLVDEIKEYNPFVEYTSDFKDIIKYLKDNTKKDDVIMTIGAGDVYKIGDKLKS